MRLLAVTQYRAIVGQARVGGALGVALVGLLALSTGMARGQASGSGVTLYGTSFASNAGAGSLFKVTVGGSAASAPATVYDFEFPIAPDGLLFDRQGNVIYADTAIGGIHRLDLSDPANPMDTVLGYGAQTPADLALAPGGGYVLASDFFRPVITRIDLGAGGGAQYLTIGDNLGGAAGNYIASGMAFDVAGNLFANVSTPTQNFLARLDPTNGDILSQAFVSDALDGLTFDSSTGTLFAASRGRPGIYAFDAASLLSAPLAPTFIDFTHPTPDTVQMDSTITADFSAAAQDASDPYRIGTLDGITADGAGHVFIAGPVRNRIYEYSLADRTLGVAANVSQVDDLAPAFGAGSFPTRGPDASPVPEGSTLLLWAAGVLLWTVMTCAARRGKRDRRGAR